MKAKTRAVNALSPGRFIGKEFSEKARLIQSTAFDWHRAAVGLEKIEIVFSVDLESKYFVGNQTALHLTTHVHVPLEWLLSLACFRSKGKFVLGEESNSFTPLAGKLDGHHDVRN